MTSGMSSASRLTSPLGKFVSLSLTASQAVQIHSIEAGSANEVPRDVFRRVLQGAYLAVKLQRGPTEAFYFVKSNIYEAAPDLKTLRRLGPSVNLTSHEANGLDSSTVIDVKVHLDNTVLSLRYGASMKAEKARVLRHAAKITVRRAWQRQKDLLISQRTLEAHLWTSREKDQLVRQGSVSNYEVTFFNSLEEFPELAADLSNVVFRKIKP